MLVGTVGADAVAAVVAQLLDTQVAQVVTPSPQAAQVVRETAAAASQAQHPLLQHPQSQVPYSGTHPNTSQVQAAAAA